MAKLHAVNGAAWGPRGWFPRADDASQHLRLEVATMNESLAHRAPSTRKTEIVYRGEVVNRDAATWAAWQTRVSMEAREHAARMEARKRQVAAAAVIGKIGVERARAALKQAVANDPETFTMEGARETVDAVRARRDASRKALRGMVTAGAAMARGAGANGTYVDGAR